MAVVTPISGSYYVAVGDTITLSDAQVGGTWSSSDSSIATVSVSGVVTGVSVGNVTIYYTVGSDYAFRTITVMAQSVTNGMDIIQVMNAFCGRIGWRQPTISGVPTLSADNFLSYSGRRYDGVHPMVTLNNLYYTQENADITDEQFNTYLAALDQDVTMRVLNAVFNRPPLIEHKLSFNRSNWMFNRTITNVDNVVGYKINIGPGDHAVCFNAVSLYFDGAATFDIYLFNDLIEAPVKQKTVTTVANTQVKVQLDWVVNYNSDFTNGGIWYIVYFQRDLGTVHAVDEQLNMWTDTKMFGVIPVQSRRIGDLNFNRNNPSSAYNSYGLNLEMSSYRDYTRMCVTNPSLFDEARILMMGVTALETIKYSTGTNTTQKQAERKAAEISLDMNIERPTTDFPYASGIKAQLRRELERLNKVVMPYAGPQTHYENGMGYNPWGDYQGFYLANMPIRNR